MKQKIILEETKQGELMSKKHNKVCTLVNHVEHFLILALAITGSISIFVFPVFLGIPMGIASSAIGLKFAQ